MADRERQDGDPSDGDPGRGSRRLDEDARRKAAQGPTPPEAWIIHEIVREDGEREIRRTLGSLAWSGFGAGLSMGFSFLTLSLVRAGLPKTEWQPLVSGFGYTVGFLIAVLGRQQLFTESTLTAVLPFLTRPDLATALKTLRLWAVVLSANIAGTIAFAALISYPGLFSEPVVATLKEVSVEVLGVPFAVVTLRAVLSGWLIALIVWLMPGAGPARLVQIVVLTYVVSISQFYHVIAGSVEVAFAVINGEARIADYLVKFALPTLIGNTLGGVSLVAILNHAPVSAEIERGSVR